MAKHAISQRRACNLASVDPKTVRRERVPDCPEIRQRMREIASERRRFGYRRIGVMLAREGMAMNHKKLRRLYREEGLAVKRRRGRKRATGTRKPLSLPAGPSQRWSLDFLSDVFGTGRRFRILAVIDDFTRECLGLIADTSISGLRVARELAALVRLYGKPTAIVSDNGTELTSRAMLEWRDTRTALAGIILRPASRHRTPSSKASTDACGTSSLMKRSSKASPMRAGRLADGAMTTTMSARIRRTAD